MPEAEPTPATQLTVAAYLTAAQTAFSAGDFDACRRQIILGQMELSKLVQSDGFDGETTQYRATFDNLLTQVDAYAARLSRGTRRSILREV